MDQIVVFDFDRTLTNYDTTLPFFFFCCRKRLVRFVYFPIIFLIATLAKFGFFSPLVVKKYGLKLICPRNIHEFKSYCREFSCTIKLNEIYNDYFLQYIGNSKIIIASGSFYDYLEFLFPDFEVIATTLRKEKNMILGISDHPVAENKAKTLRKKGYVNIDVFYTDSKLDLPTANLSKKTHFVRKGKLLFR